MKIETADDILKKVGMTDEEAEEDAEIKKIKKAVSVARNAIHDAKQRYVKQRLKLKKKSDADGDPFAELAEYNTREDIRDCWGWGMITEAQMDHLMELWDAREESRRKSANAAYCDYVTNILDAAWYEAGQVYAERIEAHDKWEEQRRKEAEKIARENNERTRKRELGLII